MPSPGNPAFSWQGSVAGVNTGNGNKTTAVPITGWTQCGGMKVSCTLYHNSQGPLYGGYGSKWLTSYFTYISGGSSAPVLHWDNGLTCAFIKNGTAYIAPYGILDTLTYSSGTFTLTTPDQTVYTFAFAPGNAYLSSVADMDGNTLSIGHNADTTISFVKDCTGRTLTYNYSGGLLYSVTDPLGRIFAMFYTGSDLTQVNTPILGGNYYALTVIGYDGNHNINSLKSTRGFASTFGYDTAPLPRLIWAKDSLGNQTTFTYNPNNTVVADPNGHTTTHTYSGSALASVTDALGKISKTTYDYNNIATSTTDKRGNVWANSSHFSNGSSTSSSADPYGNTSSATYDSKNKVIKSVDPVGNTTVNTYTTDSKEDLLTTSITGYVTAPGTVAFKATSTVGGYTNGLPTTSTDPLGFVSYVGYDANGYPNSAVDPAKDPASTAVFNVLGWKLSGTDANSHTTTSTYDNWGRVTAVTAPDNAQTTTTYDLDGNVLTVTDANNHTVTNVYDADDRLIKMTNGRGDVVTYTYDGNDHVMGTPQRGLLSSKTDGNQHTTYYSYTARNEPSATYYADGTSESVAYDENGNTLSRTKPDGTVIGYAYDKANHLTDITYPHMAATHFDYDRAARKTHMHDATGDTYWDYTYDGVHQTAQTSSQGTVYYAFDSDGRRSVRQLAGTGSWNYSYDMNGRLYQLTSPKDGTTTYAYDGAGRLTQKTKGNGDYELYGYDVANQLKSIGYWFLGGTYQNGLSYTYDPAGNVSTVNQGFYATAYGYDGADQLTAETNSGTYPPPNLGFTYDHNGNRLTLTVNGSQAQGFAYDAHDKLTNGTAGNEIVGYDLNGNETSVSIGGGVYRDAYDDEDRLTSVTLPNGFADRYTYNGLGLRVGKTDSIGTYSYICDGTTPGSPVLADGHALYTPGLSENRNGTSAYYSNDRLGNLWTLNGSTKSQLGYIDFSGFGGMTAAGGSGSPFGFGGGNGCQTEADTGFVLMGHRYYDTRIGRFISRDPIKDGNNWYAYCDNNPINRTDPLGLVCAPFDSTGMGIGQIYDYVTSHGGLPGEEYGTKDQNGNLIPGYSFIVSGFNFMGMSFVAPQGSNINNDISRARQFYQSDASKDWRSIGHGKKIFMHDPKKVGDWLINNYGPGTEGDPKQYGKQYDAYGHAIYAAAAAELQVTLPTILDGEVGVHNLMHPFSPGEQENGEIAGWGYDKLKYPSGTGLWTDSDFVPSALGFAWQKVTGN